ncbi:hypothetical protein ACQP2X_12390 [Actinoplanes sp. CA-131856]
MIVAGEISATLVLFADTPEGDIPGMAASICLLAMTLSTIIVGVTSLSRIPRVGGVHGQIEPAAHLGVGERV